MKAIDVKTSTYIDFDIENNDKNSKFKVGGHAKTSKYKNIYGKGYAPKTYKIEDLNDEEIVGKTYEKNIPKNK